MNILQITPHLGGGVGTVVLNYLEKIKSRADMNHRVICLDYANDHAKEKASDIGFFIADNMGQDQSGVLSEIKKADIVLIHWWNHPLLYDLLVRETLPHSRIILWSHISGFNAPYVFPAAALVYPDLFVFTTPLSLDVPEVRDLGEKNKKSLRTVWSTGGIEKFLTLKPKPHKGFKVGYVGTVDYCKMHRNFLKMSAKIKIPNVEFIVCGGPSENEIQAEATKNGFKNKITFTGKISNVGDYLTEFDVFGYPLAPDHFGTCEQALIESMAAGVPPVVMANKAEKYIVKNEETGLVAKNEDEYARAIEKLYFNEKLRERLSKNARCLAERRFSIDRMISDWDKIFAETLKINKSAKRWSGKYSGKLTSPAELFLESLGNHGGSFKQSYNSDSEEEKRKSSAQIKSLCEESLLWKGNSKGTPGQYREFFPEDEFLELWSSLAND